MIKNDRKMIASMFYMLIRMISLLSHKDLTEAQDAHDRLKNLIKKIDAWVEEE